VGNGEFRFGSLSRLTKTCASAVVDAAAVISGGPSAVNSGATAPKHSPTVGLPAGNSEIRSSSGVVLGIDYGTVRIGIARSNVERTLALGLTVIDNNSKALDELTKIIADYRVTHLFFGDPLHLNAQTSASAQRARQFAEQLFQRSQINYSFVDERLSSVEAQKNLQRIHGQSRFDKSELDIESARIILLRALKL
jgi:putative Holliday junction resolvase